ncbi:MAG TPA: ImmA/IrrE family metallo-endopeptidase [archaeon]|nr:ImmA/IrrE family metallo-endopeptidase [archaeon]
MSYLKVRDITFNILSTCRINAPPVDLEPVLKHFRTTVVNSNHIAESALLGKKGDWTVKVNPGLRHERRTFRIAHEIGHIYWSDPAHHLGDPTLGGKLEKYCSKFASLLLCPFQWFIKDAPEADYDLFALKKIYSNVSHEVLATRLCYLASIVVTIYDNGKLYRRFASPGLTYPCAAQKPELEVYEAVDLYGDYRELNSLVSWGGIERRVRVKGYPVFSGKFRRIILLMTPLEMEPEDYTGIEEDMPYPFPEY